MGFLPNVLCMRHVLGLFQVRFEPLRCLVLNLGERMRRRDLLVLGSVAAVWPLAGYAQQTGRVRKIGLLQGLAASDPDWQRRLAAFRQGLADLGWVEGRNFVFESRYADAKPNRLPALAAELVQANVDVIVTNAA